MFFLCNRSSISYFYSINGSPFTLVTLIKDLVIYFSPTFFFEFHLNDMTVSIKVLGFIKRNTTNFSSTSCFHVLYFSLVRFFFFCKYGILVQHLQFRFLYAIAFLLKIYHPQHDYYISIIRFTLQIPSLALQRIEAD